MQRETWIDWRSIPDSAKWRGEIFAAIEAADNFLFVISPDSVKSWMCGQEVSHAVANNKRLITVLYHSVERKELLPALAEIQWIDYPNLGFEQTFERLTAAIDTDLDWVRKHTRFLSHNVSQITKGIAILFSGRLTQITLPLRHLLLVYDTVGRHLLR